MPGPLRIDEIGVPDAFIIDDINRREREKSDRIQPHAPSPMIEDWRPFPEDRTPGDVNPSYEETIISPDEWDIDGGHNDGTVKIGPGYVFSRTSRAVQQVIEA
jgi:hypothetical protein